MRVILAAILLIGPGSKALCQNFVLKNDTYGYLYNNNGTLAVSQDFSPASIWISNSSDPTSTGQTLMSYTDNSMYLRSSANGSASLGSSQNSWQKRSGGLAYRENNTSYYLKYNNGSFVTTTGNNGYRFDYYTVTDDDLDSLYGPYTIMSETDLSLLSEHPYATFEVKNSFTVSSSFTPITGFNGVFNGNYHVISGLTQPLFNTVNNGTVKNVILDNVTVNGGDYAGAIANRALGDARIYNCGVLSSQGSSVSGTGSVGGLVGEVSGNAKVVNCYNYATVTGGTYAAGIVGRVSDSSVASNESYSLSEDGTSINPWSRTGNGLGGNFKANNNNRPNNYKGNLSGGTIEAWINANTGLQNQQIRHTVLNNLTAGRYTVSLTAVMVNQQNNSYTPQGAYFYLNGNTYPISGSVQGTNGNRYVEQQISISLDVSQNGTIELGFNISNSRYFNWLLWDNLTITKEISSYVHVSNCMMYGDITGGTNRSPVYGGDHISNDRYYHEYNYYRSKANLTYTSYNNQLAIDKDEFLTRFPFYRQIQNTHREMASFFLFDDHTDAHVSEIGHWVLKPDVAPYPVIESWTSDTQKTTDLIARNLPVTSQDYEGRLLKEMGNDGYLTVNVRINGMSYTSALPITDMDTARFDYTWGKVVLPFANEYSGWTRDYSKICTGWKITSVTGGTEGTLANYNFADRNCTVKDIYDETANPYIFAQGGNYIVPYGVTSITIEANFANAFYLSDASYDVGYSNTYNNPVALGGETPVTYHGMTVYNNLQTLVNSLSNSTNPHSQAIVLVGNYHYNQNVTGVGFNTAKAVTVMSIDEDNNQEPDYGWYSYHTTDRTQLPPIRFDFVPNVGLGMTARVTGSTPYPTIGIWHASGWFELTETSLSFMSECEVNSGRFTNEDNGYGNNRWIANSGYFMQIIRGYNSGVDNKLSYLQIGGNAYVEQYYPGSHVARNYNTELRPMVVTGGEIKECYMTGNKNNALGSDILFWCAGGRMHKWLAAFTSNPSTNGVNVTAKIDHAIIGRFFGGGTSAAARITGNIDVTIDNSLVDFYCGGPEFGDMSNGKTVTTHAKGTTFGEYYGAGFGGTSLSTVYILESTNVSFANDITYPLAFSNYQRLQTSGSYGLGVGYAFDYIVYSGGTGVGVARFYTKYARFSLATTGNVTNVLEGCTVKGNYYGAGCQGKVNGTVTSTLTDCTFEGSVFGGGYKASANTLDVYPTTQPEYSRYTKETGIFSGFGHVDPETWTWKQGSVDTYDAGSKTIYTDVDMSTLGNVTGAISLTISGGSVANDVFGGGNESPSRNNAEVTVTDNTVVRGNVFGGGNLADVSGSVTVNVTDGDIRGDIYGGGALAHTNTNSVETLTRVNLSGGNVNNVYGGGLGDESHAATVGTVIVELNNNVSASTRGCAVSGSIFGCNNVNGTPHGNVMVHVFATQNPARSTVLSKDPDVFDMEAVYGGGNKAAYMPANPAAGKTHVVIEGCGLSCIRYVYGGGNAAPVPATDVQIMGSYSIGDVFGGGNGKDSITVAGVLTANPGADVGIREASQDEWNATEVRLRYSDKGGLKDNDTYILYGDTAGTDIGTTHVTILGGTVNQVFGGSNTKGDIVKYAVVDLGDQDLKTCEFNVSYVYGGSNEAYMSGSAAIDMRCIEGISELYGGSKMADVNGDIVLTVNGGRYDRVFGGNNISGRIYGSITVNVEQTGCLPIEIGELYGCGNMAPYSVYGYQNTTRTREIDGKSVVHYDLKVNGDTHSADPLINIVSCDSIGTVYGGGFKAEVVGNPTVNVNMIKGWTNGLYTGQKEGNTETHPELVNTKYNYDYIGTVDNVFGGGNQAVVIGNTSVYIGDSDTVTVHNVTKAVYEAVKNRHRFVGESPFAQGDPDDATADIMVTTEGATVTGNVYGGGNQAAVNGQTRIRIGAE